MSGIRYYLFVPKITASNTGAVRNDGGVPAMLSGLEANRPGAGVTGRIYIATDTGFIYRDNGTSWDKIGSNAVTVNNFPVKPIEASSNIIDQIVVTPSPEIAQRLYNYVPLVNRTSVQLSDLSYFTDVKSYGNYIYAIVNNTTPGGELLIVHVGNPLAPGIVSETTSVTRGVSLDVKGNFLYIARRTDGNNVISCIDISDPTLPSIKWSYAVEIGNTVDSLTVRGNYLYATHQKDGGVGWKSAWLSIFDISGDLPSRISLTEVRSSISVQSPSNLIMPIILNGNYAYVSSSVGYTSEDQKVIDVIDIRDPLAPLAVIRQSFYCRKFVIQGSYLYLLGLGVIRIIDISNPTNWVLKGSWNSSELGITSMDSFCVSGNYAYVIGLSSGGAKVCALDVSNPGLVKVVKSVFLPTPTGGSVTGGTLITINGNYVYAIIGSNINKVFVFG